MLLIFGRGLDLLLTVFFETVMYLCTLYFVHVDNFILLISAVYVKVK